LISGFALFRFFDVLKPFGIRKLQLLPGGLGVMIDDLAAALCSACLLYFGKTFALSFNQYLF
jgi:phosphatidylglycerophosphatase A